MARGKARANPPTQSTTLRDFFGPQSLVPQTRDKTRKAKGKGKAIITPKPQAKCLREEDIIIIDSSDEDHDRAPKASASKKRRRSDSDHIPLSSLGDDCTTNTLARPMFGEPSKLLRPTSSRPLPKPPCKPTHSIPALDTKLISFGPPSSLLPPSSKPRAHESAFPSVAPPEGGVSSEIQVVDIDLTLEPDDEWGTGDDERGQLPSAEDDEGLEDEIIDLTDQLDNEHFCPVCTKTSDQKLPDFCCTCKDRKREPKSSPSASETLKPLSALPVPLGPTQLKSCDGKTGPSSNANAFSLLMSSTTDKEAWKEASSAEDHNFRPSKENGGRRKAPFYKIMQGMPIAVDAFRYGTIPHVTAYFLTHAHSDHYTNLSSNWKSGPIYCSEGTANLIIHMLSVDKKWVHPLPMDVPTTIPHTGGVQVTLIEANHCPGSCLFLFEGQQTMHAGDSSFKSPFIGTARTFRYLHCGDFRASPQHILHPAVAGKRIDHVYLDTTYLDPKYTFPPQPQVISACAELARRLVNGEGGHAKSTMETWMNSSPNKAVAKSKSKEGYGTLIVVGTYSIGKERIVKAIAHALGTKVYCDNRKAAILRCQSDPDLHALLTTNPLEASVHLVPLGVITSDKLKPYVERYKAKFSQAIGFRPTGWTYSQPAGSDPSPSIETILSRSQQRVFTYADLRPARNSTTGLQLFPVPYSEHSSFFELTCFALSFDWGKMIATVNVGSESSRAKMAKWVARWEAEKKKRVKVVPIPYRHEEYW
ncbi:hypothetical protein HGRIS_004603 [Hohenbuehelia grisea]|uniref:DRMBL-domain-containing protein n=1 Tax=Hohenbuehelia grisea TaxID=104357 RepID=A0ABR3JDM0_9AGAR